MGKIKQVCYSKGLGGAEEHVRMLQGLESRFSDIGSSRELYHTHLPRADLFGCYKKMVCHAHWVATVHGHYAAWRGGKLRAVMPRVWNKADKVIAISGEVRRWLIGMGVRREKIVVVHYGIQVSYPTETVGTTPMVIGTIGRLEPRKGMDRLIRAMPEVLTNFPDATLEIVGRSDRGYGEGLKALAKEIGVRDSVSFIGEILHEVIPTWLDGITVYAQASREEGLGLAVLEAMAMGKPIVVSDIPAFREIVRFKNDLVDESLLSWRLNWALNSRKLHMMKGKLNRDHVERNFSVEAMVGKLRGVYGDCIQSRRMQDLRRFML